MNRFYLIPTESVPIETGISRGPKYFWWPDDPDPPALLDGVRYDGMVYGFLPSMLLVADLTAEQHTALIANADVYAFPIDIDTPVADPVVDTFFEAINIPTDWLTPSTTYRELLRQLAGMFQFNQRYGGIAAQATGELHSIFDNATLSTRLRQMTAQEQAWFLATVASFGFNPDLVNTNSQLRLLVRLAGDYWIGKPFKLGDVVF